MQPLKKKVVIRPAEKEDVTSTGIIKVSAHTDKFTEGHVVAVGPEVKELKEGHRILYSPLTYDEIEYDAEVFHVVDVEDVFAIIPDEE